MLQWLRVCGSKAEGVGSVPGQGTKIPHATQQGEKTNKQTENQESEGKKCNFKVRKRFKDIFPLDREKKVSQ